jgi:hypothetical protein
VTESGARGPTSPAEPADERRANIIGGVMVAFALLIGVVLLAKGFGDDGGLVTTASDSAQSSSDGNGQGFDTPTTSTTVPAVNPATVKVLVANGSGTKTGARIVADYLGTKGFVAPQVGNAPNQANSAVYYTAGNAPQAQLVAADLGLDPSVVLAMATPAPVTDLKGATVLVLIGTDGKLVDPAANAAAAAATGSTDTTA